MTTSEPWKSPLLTMCYSIKINAKGWELKWDSSPLSTGAVCKTPPKSYPMKSEIKTKKIKTSSPLISYYAPPPPGPFSTSGKTSTNPAVNSCSSHKKANNASTSINSSPIKPKSSPPPKLSSPKNSAKKSHKSTIKKSNHFQATNSTSKNSAKPTLLSSTTLFGNWFTTRSRSTNSSWNLSAKNPSASSRKSLLKKEKIPLTTSLKTHSWLWKWTKEMARSFTKMKWRS